MITVASRRAHLASRTRGRRHAARRGLYPFCYYEAAANLLTNPVSIRSARFRNSVALSA
jgi:hypothetical protein